MRPPIPSSHSLFYRSTSDLLVATPTAYTTVGVGCSMLASTADLPSSQNIQLDSLPIPAYRVRSSERTIHRSIYQRTPELLTVPYPASAVTRRAPRDSHEFSSSVAHRLSDCFSLIRIHYFTFAVSCLSLCFTFTLSLNQVSAVACDYDLGSIRPRVSTHPRVSKFPIRKRSLMEICRRKRKWDTLGGGHSQRRGTVLPMMCVNFTSYTIMATYPPFYCRRVAVV